MNGVKMKFWSTNPGRRGGFLLPCVKRETPANAPGFQCVPSGTSGNAPFRAYTCRATHFPSKR